MIASLQGVVESLESDGAVINVTGVGFRVTMPTSFLSTIGGIGEEVKVYTHLHHKEDDVALYGFASTDELRLFETLIGVSGLGPRLALAMLSTLDVEQMTLAITTGSTEMLTTVPGIGKKMASRLVLELKDKLDKSLITVQVGQIAGESSDVLAALTSLGYSVAEASRAVAALPSSPELTVEDRVRQALQYLGGK
jgi:Holliday junction DNA helicase RuvA